MFELSSTKVDFEKENTLIKRSINLDNDLDCFILISTDDSNLGELLLNNILDFIIDKISKDNTYNDFSIALESINSFIKNWNTDSEEEVKLDIIISILNKNNFIFSNIGKSSCYLLNGNNEVIELTNKSDNKKRFNYVSNGELKNNEIVVSSTRGLLNYLSKSDLLDGLVLSDDLNLFNKNIKNILLSENGDNNIMINSVKYTSALEEPISKVDLVKNHFIKYLDNKVSKNIIGYFLVLKDKLNSQTKTLKNIVFLGGITLSIFFLYSILSTVAGITTQNDNKELATKNINEVKTYIRIASENVSNNDVFESNIQKAEDILKKVENNQLFLNNVSKLNDDINILKKQFNKIEIFEGKLDNAFYSENIENPVKILKNSLKPYIITKNGVIGPILPNKKAKNHIFNSLEKNEEFVDVAFIGENMYLLTSLSKIVKFTKSGYFSYIDVSGQDTWEKAKAISSYAQNIYLIGSEDNQIYKHKLYGNSFKAGNEYLKKDDLTQIGEINSIAIDGGFYILKKDLSIIKFFSDPYRIEKIVINNLPKNYDIIDEKSIIDLKARKDLNYVYLLLNNKIWVFKPNTNLYKNTKSLTYVGQIEGKKDEIKDFYINRDGEIIILNKKGLFKVNFEISNNRLLIR